jgi:hypothetical protein
MKNKLKSVGCWTDSGITYVSNISGSHDGYPSYEVSGGDMFYNFQQTNLLTYFLLWK